jgi:hypothetical protein
VEREAICNAIVEMSLVTSMFHLLQIDHVLSSYLETLRHHAGGGFVCLDGERCVRHYIVVSFQREIQGRMGPFLWLKSCNPGVGSESTCNGFNAMMHLYYNKVISLLKFQNDISVLLGGMHCSLSLQIFRVIDAGERLVEPGANGRAILPSFVMTHLQRSLSLALSQHSHKFLKPAHEHHQVKETMLGKH